MGGACLFGPLGCVSEDAPDDQEDAAADSRRDISVRTPDGGNCVGGGDAARDGALGMMAVQTFGCARCHQDTLDGPLVLSGRRTSLVPDAGVYGRNLTPDPETGLGCWTDEQITRAILSGIDNEGRELCRMPKFGSRMDGGVAQEIVDFLRTLEAVHQEMPEIGVCPPSSTGDAGRGDGGRTDGGADDGGAGEDVRADARRPDADDGVADGGGADGGGADGDGTGDGGTGDADAFPPGDGRVDAPPPSDGAADGVAPDVRADAPLDGAAPDTNDDAAIDGAEPDAHADGAGDGGQPDGDASDGADDGASIDGEADGAD